MFQVDVSPPLAGDLATAQAGEGEVPGMHASMRFDGSVRLPDDEEHDTS